LVAAAVGASRLRRGSRLFLTLFAEITAQRPATLLELGSGGGNNALHMKAAFASVTLVDLLREIGFRPAVVSDPFGRQVFIGRRP
jgi:hypothetical protein